jgi:hypothetical protein
MIKALRAGGRVDALSNQVERRTEARPAEKSSGATHHDGLCQVNRSAYSRAHSPK